MLGLIGVFLYVVGTLTLGILGVLLVAVVMKVVWDTRK